MAEQGEIIRLGEAQGVVVDRKNCVQGLAYFAPEEGAVTVYLYEARDPDVPLHAVEVSLIAEETGGARTGRYAVMADDAYWGRRVQPARFLEPPFTETLVMGYRLRGHIRHDGVPQEGANISFRVTSQTAEDGEVVWWDSEEYNALIWSFEKDTYVSGPTVLAPVRTEASGRWEFIVPRGHGAIYQRAQDRRDDTAETAEEPLARYVERVEVAYRGRQVEAREGEDADLDWQSGRVRLTATPGAVLRVGVLEDSGGQYTVPPEGVVEIGGLPAGQVSVAQYRQNNGDWDPAWGCPRVCVPVVEGETTEAELPPLEQYPTDGSVVCGRVYRQPGVPAAGVEIVAVDPELLEVAGTVATTDSSGYWSVEVPPEGLGGLLYIMDPEWGSAPVLGLPYSDVVLGARVYAGWMDHFRPEAWRTGTLGHKNFAWVPGSVWVQDHDTGTLHETEESPAGGWITREALPKWRYVADAAELLIWGPQLKARRLLVDGEVEDPEFYLRGQSFSNWSTEAGNYRASGYYLEKKLLLGGKLKHNVALAGEERIDQEWPEAARVGLEFGRHQPFVEVRTGRGGAGEVGGVFADLLCPYCGGPVERRPGKAVPRGFCRECYEAWGIERATDARGYARSVTLAAREERYGERAVALTTRGGWAQAVGYHWRPDLYEESSEWLRTDGPGMRTNAPRWWARHVHEVGDGKGLGQFDGDREEPYVEGHALEYFEGLSGRELGVAQFKLAFEAEYVAPQEFTVEIDCERVDGVVETVRVTAPAGTRGPNELVPLGEVIPLSRAPKLAAEGGASPRAGLGLYRAVRGIRLVEPAEGAPGCRFTVTNDVPLLAHTGGVRVPRQAAEFVALQILAPRGRPHLAEDPVGRLFLFRAVNGDIEMRRRSGLTRRWSGPRRIVRDGLSDYPWAGFGERQRLVLVRQRGGETVIAHSTDGGETWEEV